MNTKSALLAIFFFVFSVFSLGVSVPSCITPPCMRLAQEFCSIFREVKGEGEALCHYIRKEAKSTSPEHCRAIMRDWPERGGKILEKVKQRYQFYLKKNPKKARLYVERLRRQIKLLLNPGGGESGASSK